ncbi:hypothetical protein AB0N05_10845 [Nocardia sp. NPDC051030]|uniref:hypothetical protein n=1 Tax=Nocardia sp. NPDC051030 TaxID=3155162 RepID=UPI00341C1E14
MPIDDDRRGESTQLIPRDSREGLRGRGFSLAAVTMPPWRVHPTGGHDLPLDDGP